MNLNHTEVQALLETLRKKLAKSCGVTLVEDASGEYGPLGTNYLTLRFNGAEGRLVKVSTQVTQVSVR